MLGLHELKIGKKYKYIQFDNKEEIFTYLGTEDEILNEQNVLLEDGTKSFLVDGDQITEI